MLCLCAVLPPILPIGQQSLRSEELNYQLVRRLHAHSPYVPSGIRVNGRFAIRPCLINPRTERSDITALVQSVRAVGEALAAEAA